MRQPDYVPLRIPFSQGINEVWERGTIPTGAFSRMKNMRWRGDGSEQRLGHAYQHTAATDNTNEIISGYSFSKGRRTERALFAQYADGEVRKATSQPPTVTTGEFGTQVLAPRHSDWAGTTVYVEGDIVFSTTSKLLRLQCTVGGTSDSTEPTLPALGETVADNTVTWIAIEGVSPASWANYRDYVLFADGAGQAQIYTGEQQVPVLVNVYKGTAMPDVPTEGSNYLEEATDGQASTVVILDSLSTLANFDGFFIGFDTPVNKITLTIPAPNVNASVATVHYRKNDSTWADTSDTDGTISGGASLGQTGSFTWTLPTDEVPHYAFGTSCFLYRITFSAALDAEVEISAVTGENTSGFQDVQNIWNGVLVDAVQALTLDTSATAYYKYAGLAIKMTDFVWAGGANDYLYVASQDRSIGGFLDVGYTPNTAGGTIDQVATWTDAGWTAVTGLNDGTAGGSNSGHVTWARNDSARQTMFKGDVEAYWYRIRFSANVAGAASMSWAFSTMPYFNNIYPICQSIAVWDKRVWSSYNDNNLYGTATGFPMSINGDDSVKITVGDFRSNKNVALRKFYNFMLVWQKEKGEEGGGFHIIQPGAAAAGYASQVISDKIGIMNSKSAVVLEDVGMVDMNSERPIMKGVYFITRYGIYKTDGDFLRNVSGGIANYFDPSKSEGVRAGYEDRHYLVWDSMYKVIRLGIISGSSATAPNKFFIYNYTTDVWAEDTLEQKLSSIFEVEAASGNVPVLQYGGTQDGNVLRLNTTNDDISTPIDADVIMELDADNDKLVVAQELLRSKVQSAGDISRSVSVDGNTTYEYNRTIKMTERVSGETYRREEKLTDHLEGDHLSFRWRNNTASQSMYLLDVEFRVKPKYNR